MFSLVHTELCPDSRLNLSNFYRPIYLFRYDVDREEIFIIAGQEESIEITIFNDGKWRYEIVEL